MTEYKQLARNVHPDKNLNDEKSRKKVQFEIKAFSKKKVFNFILKKKMNVLRNYWKPKKH